MTNRAEIRPGVWIVGGSEWNGDSIQETKQCDECRLRALVPIRNEDVALCLWGRAAKVLLPTPKEQRKSCSKIANAPNVKPTLDVQEWIKKYIYFAPNKDETDWHWLLPGFEGYFDQEGRVKTRGGRKIVFKRLEF